MSLKQIINPEITSLPDPDALPKNLLYSIAADIGGTGLATTASEGLKASNENGFLGRAIGYANAQDHIRPEKITSLKHHPVRLLGSIGSERYYGAKKRYLDWIASRTLEKGDFDFFHGWSGDSLRSLITARQKNIPSAIEIPTWHRNKGLKKPFQTKSDREMQQRSWLDRLEVGRDRVLTEYELVDLVLVQSQKAAETFLDIGMSPDRICYVARGVNVETFQPTKQPDRFRLTFVGALIKRKGIHHLLKAWHQLNLKDAELCLVGSVHPEMEDALKEYKTDSVNLVGFTHNVRDYLGKSSAFVFPSECEGSAKATFEATASALPMIMTREAGDACQDGLNGKIIPANDSDALADAIQYFYNHPDKVREMGAASRQLTEKQFTWDHHRTRLLHAYATARARH